MRHTGPTSIAIVLTLFAAAGPSHALDPHEIARTLEPSVVRIFVEEP